MQVHGFTVKHLAELVRTGLATATPEFAGAKTIEGARLRITEAGRQTLADML
jgi:hypothetical protein